MNELKFTAPGPIASAFLRSNARRRVLMGPFGSGKSVTSMVEILRRAGEQHHGSGPLGSGFRYSRWAIVRNTVPQLRDTTMKTWFSWFPNGSIGYYRATEKTYYIEVGDIRAEVMFRALDDENDVKNLLSLELTGAFFNECREIPREIVDAMDGRIVRYPAVKDGGQTWRGMWGDTNPPDEGDYWWAVIEGLNATPGDDFGMPLPVGEDNGWEAFKQPSGLSPYAENISNLADGYYRDLVKGKTKEFIKVYVHGQYGNSKSGSPVYPDFNESMHVVEGLIANPHRPIVISADFGLTPAMVLKQQDVHGRVLALDEVVTQGMGLDRAIETKLKPLLANRYHDATFFVTGDPAGNTPAQTDESTCVKIFKSHGFKKVKFAFSNDPVARRGATDHFLHQLSGTGTASALYDKRRVPVLIRGLKSGYHYPVNKKGIRSDNVEKNIYSHICEADEYGNMLYQKGFAAQGSALPGNKPRNPGQMVPAGTYSGRR